MTVKELIEKLNQFDDDTEVNIGIIDLSDESMTEITTEIESVGIERNGEILLYGSYSE